MACSCAKEMVAAVEKLAATLDEQAAASLREYGVPDRATEHRAEGVRSALRAMRGLEPPFVPFLCDCGHWHTKRYCGYESEEGVCSCDEPAPATGVKADLATELDAAITHADALIARVEEDSFDERRL